jgi:Phytanoyl-CoA dioxygenase (PhyH)
VSTETVVPGTDHGAISAQPDRAPLLTTVQMAEFVSRGFLRFDALIPESLNNVAAKELADPSNRLGRRYPHASRLDTLFGEYPGIRGVLDAPAVQGILGSLVGPSPIYDHHAVHKRAPGAGSQHLHGDAIIDLRAGFDIQLMYYPEEVSPAAGGTLLVPGSHLRRINERDIGRYQNLAGQVALACPAGTVVIVHHGIWHCGRRNGTDRDRYMFKLRLGARGPQHRLWDTSDLADPGARQQVQQLLSESQPWYEHGTARLEQLQRAALWRHLTGDQTFQVEFWLGRLENQAQPRLNDLLP